MSTSEMELFRKQCCYISCFICLDNKDSAFYAIQGMTVEYYVYIFTVQRS